MLHYGVMVCTLDSLSSDCRSTPREAVWHDLGNAPAGTLRALPMLQHSYDASRCHRDHRSCELPHATKQLEHRNRMEHARDQRKNRVHGLLILSRCVRCFVPCRVSYLSPFQRLCRPAVRCAVVFDVMLLEFRLHQEPCGARIHIPGEARILLSQALPQLPCVVVASLNMPGYHAEELITLGMQGDTNLMKIHWSLAGFDRGPYGYCPYTPAS